jgi:hypothetical protein
MSDKPKYTFTFPGQKPTELKADPFLGRCVLQHAPDWIFREAERWDHPWRFLLGVRGLPPACYDLFKAAESLSAAMNLLLHMLYGGATLTRGSLAVEGQERERSGNKPGANQKARKLIRAQVRHGLWSPADEAGLATTPTLEAWARQAKAELEKRYGKNFVVPVKTVDQFIEEHKSSYLMISGWLRLGYPDLNFGDPGLAYYTDQAMANLLAAATGFLDKLHQTDVRLTYFRKIRQRFGLQHAYPRKPIVVDARRVQGPGGKEIEIQMERTDGSCFWKPWGAPLR